MGFGGEVAVNQDLDMASRGFIFDLGQEIA
jgi:hypothetical protein